MCAYNAAAHIGEAIQSVLDQSLKDFELIVVENGSTDSTWEIIQSFQDKRIRPLRTSIRQLAFNLNFAINEARASLIARMDADDVCHRDRLSLQVAFLEAHPKVTVLGTAFEVFGSSTATKKIHPPTTDAP